MVHLLWPSSDGGSLASSDEERRPDAPSRRERSAPKPVEPPTVPTPTGLLGGRADGTGDDLEGRPIRGAALGATAAPATGDGGGTIALGATSTIDAMLLLGDSPRAAVATELDDEFSVEGSGGVRASIRFDATIGATLVLRAGEAGAGGTVAGALGRFFGDTSDTSSSSAIDWSLPMAACSAARTSSLPP